MSEEKHECSYVTDEVAEDIIKRLNIPDSVSVVHDHESKSLFVSVQIDDNRTYKFEFNRVDETFPTVVLEEFLEPFCNNIAKTAEKYKDSSFIELFLHSEISNTVLATGLENVRFLFDTDSDFEYKAPPQKESKQSEQ